MSKRCLSTLFDFVHGLNVPLKRNALLTLIRSRYDSRHGSIWWGQDSAGCDRHAKESVILQPAAGRDYIFELASTACEGMLL